MKRIYRDSGDPFARILKYPMEPHEFIIRGMECTYHVSATALCQTDGRCVSNFCIRFSPSPHLSERIHFPPTRLVHPLGGDYCDLQDIGQLANGNNVPSACNKNSRAHSMIRFMTINFVVDKKPGVAQQHLHAGPVVLSLGRDWERNSHFGVVECDEHGGTSRD